MNPLQDCKFLQVIAPTAILDDGSWTTTEIDTKDWEYLTIVFNLGASDIAMAALKVQESDVSATNLTDIAGLDMDGDTDIDGGTAALPSATDDPSLVVFQIDLRDRKRFIDLVATAGDGTTGSYGSAIAILSRGKVKPNTIAEIGADTVLRV